MLIWLRSENVLVILALPSSFIDVVSIPKTNENFRLLYDTKGRFYLHSVRDEEAKFKLCKVRSVQFGKKGIPYLNTICYPDPLIKANDTIKSDLETYKITEFIKCDVGHVVMVTGGRNRGRVGVIKNREKHKGSFETIHIQDAIGHEFATRLGNVFTIGKDGIQLHYMPPGLFITTVSASILITTDAGRSTVNSPSVTVGLGGRWGRVPCASSMPKQSLRIAANTPITDTAMFKLRKVRSVQFGKKGIPYLNTYDGRTIRYPDPLIKANETIKFDLETYKITEFIKFDVGSVVMVTGGRNRGRVGVIKNREKHKGSFETIHIQDAIGHGLLPVWGMFSRLAKVPSLWYLYQKEKVSSCPLLKRHEKDLQPKLLLPLNQVA
ncbi:hypothetical protein F0562_001138 [Nyssa sinensis]|uniref:KOW domain-containing protein n=1 Tax=Nyssa sinensis TaxID=561372 RepID=A0A5J5C3S5_9ASTE|nr:hypothetical protein F0562_001138 [Nyssa sinensis]